MKKVWVIGNGQLGLMLKHAAKPLAIEVNTVDIMHPSMQQLDIKPDDIITAERERWPESLLSKQLSEHKNFINKDVFNLMSDRLTQKKLLDKLNIPTAKWLELKKDTFENTIYNTLGNNVLLKRRIGGYDGFGQYKLSKDKGEKIPAEYIDLAIVESMVDFDYEISLVGARTKDGKFIFYPLALNYHNNGILRASIAPLSHLEKFQEEAESILSNIMEALDYEGVMAVELFVINDKLIVNELAPRVHNSGHWTQSTHVDQFQLHIRTLCGYKLPNFDISTKTVMLNLIGVEFNEKWLSLSNGEVFWYGKDVRVGRKLGHINIATNSQKKLVKDLGILAKSLPKEYSKTISWIKENFK